MVFLHKCRLNTRYVLSTVYVNLLIFCSNFIENFLCYFESYFSRKAAFHWFVLVTVGLLLRSDTVAVSGLNVCSES